MTTIKILHNENDYKIKCDGHTDSEICNGVSALVYTLAQNMIEEKEKGHINYLNLSLLSGNASIVVSAKEEYKERIDIIIDTIVKGLLMLENQFKDKVECIIEE